MRCRTFCCCCSYILFGNPSHEHKIFSLCWPREGLSQRKHNLETPDLQPRQKHRQHIKGEQPGLAVSLVTILRAVTSKCDAGPRATHGPMAHF